MRIRRLIHLAAAVQAAITATSATADDRSAPKRPNVLVAISDDQSWLHASAYGSTMVRTPHFDRVAREGILFTNAICPSPGCSPSRAAFLTGLHTWQLEHAGTHASYFDRKFPTFPDRLEESGYFVGHTGKGWGPGDFRTLGRTRNPAGPRFDAPEVDGRRGGYVEAFAAFLEARPDDRPFCFWFGSSDPHRGYRKGSGLADGRTLGDAEVPPFLPDAPEVREDLLDYAFEIERFDHDLGRMLELLEQAGELDNSLVIVTSDNGMPFPNAKANCTEYGIHMPLAIRWGAAVPGGRTVEDLVGFTDLTATIYDVTGVDPPVDHPPAGTSIAAILRSSASGIVEPQRTAVFSARERHSSSRFNSLGYPQRCVRTHRFLYVRNLAPERWPAGAPRKFAEATYTADGRLATSRLGPPHGGYHDIDAGPTLTFLIEHREDPAIGGALERAVALRPAEELFDIVTDPGCLTNLIEDPTHADVRRELADRLRTELVKTGDPRATGNGDVWETYPRVSSLRWFPRPEWAEQDPTAVPEQPWLEERRPRAK